jgi:DNA-binding transcriptional MerR regulator
MPDPVGDVAEMLTIGGFASATQLSRKALLLYGEKGLLAPARVDPDSGYRYYDPAQVRTALLIGLLRRAGMSLAEVRSFLEDPRPERLRAYEDRAAAEFADRQRILRYTHRLLEEATMYEVLTRHVQEQRYVSRSKRVYVRDLDPFIAAAFDELAAAEAPAPSFVLYRGPVNDEDDGPVEVCVPRADGDAVLPEGEIAFTTIAGEQCAFPQILGAYEAVYGWARDNGRVVDGPAREIYVPNVGGGPRMEIAVPLRNMSNPDASR